jgi:chorismate lyase/3-hydroxybenzoate synthase
MSERAISLRAAPTPRIEYRPFDAESPLPQDVLAAIAFAGTQPRHEDPRCVRVGLTPLRGAGVMEVWHASGPVTIGFDGPLRYAADADHLAGAIELDERRYGGIAGAAEAAYKTLGRFVRSSRHPHLLRVWNYFDGINHGKGDAERYKQFCAGRAAGFGSRPLGDYPAATAIGRLDGDPMLQVYWLAGRLPGLPLENPRQTSAWRYPRQYGPATPKFSRAMFASERLLMISGTASIVGHASRHRGDLRAQLDETLTNLTNVLHRAAGIAPTIRARFGAESLLKIYLRDDSMLGEVEALAGERLPPEAQYIILHADICRSELLLEVDCLHGGA